MSETEAEAIETLERLCRWLENPNAPEVISCVYGFTASHGRQVLAQLAALTQRAEQAEAEVKRLREGIALRIEACDAYGDGCVSSFTVQAIRRELAALLARPSDVTEAEDALPEL